MLVVNRLGLSLLTVKVTFGKTDTSGSVKCDDRLIVVAGESCATVTLSRGAVTVADSSARGSKGSEKARAGRLRLAPKVFKRSGTSGGRCGRGKAVTRFL